MTPRLTDVKARKDRLLNLAINHYIGTMAPVSSKTIVREFSLDLSSATVRNIFAELEEEGFLTHPHTSAGRVPTQKGYRYYVDNFLTEMGLLDEEKQKIKEEYSQEKKELDVLLEKTSKVLSDMTNCTSIVSIDGQGNKMFCQGTNFIVGYSEYQDLNKIRCILKTLDDKERLLKIINRELAKRIEVFIGQEMPCQDINICSLVVSGYKTKHGASGRIAILGPTRMNYRRVVSTLDYFSELMEEIV
ncbi:MAG: hypothetical protein P9X22_03805 [Candidatus Zapsychrus exili]|nr:hypothetical protein [Candidatus Zapsychrus exili]